MKTPKLSGEPALVEDSIGQAVCRLAQPLVQRWDNPFFSREILQLSRHRVRQGSGSTMELTTLFSGCGMVVFLLIPLLDKHFGDASSLRTDDYTPIVWMIAFCHVVFCLIAAGWGSTRIFTAERQAHTLEAVVLLPYAPGRWLTLKLAFPLYLVALAWLFGVPFYLIAALFHYGPVGAILAMPGYALMAGLASVAVCLLFTTNLLEESDLTEPASVTPAQNADTNGLSLAVLVAAIFVTGTGLARGYDLGWQMRSFYGGLLPQSAVWTLICGALWWAGTQVAMAALYQSDVLRHRADAARWLALAIIYYTGLGMLWPGLGQWQAIIALLAAPVAFFLWHHWPQPIVASGAGVADAPPGATQRVWGTRAHVIGRPPGNRLAAAEIAWLQRYWDNPVFIKDLRVACRKTSLRSGFGSSVGSLGLLLGVIYWVGPARWPDLLHSGFWLWWPFLWAFLRVLGNPAGRAADKWRLEAKGATLPLLLLTPLSSAEILKGRLGAAFLSSWGASALLMAALMAGVIWLATTAYWGFAVCGLALAPVPIAWAILWGCNLPGSATQPQRRGRAYAVSDAASLRREVSRQFTNTKATLQAGIMLQCCLVGAGCVLGFSVSTLAPPVAWALATLVCWCNVFIIPLLFHCQVACLEAARHGDIRLPKGN